MIALSALRINKIVYAETAYAFRGSVLRQRIRPELAWRHLQDKLRSCSLGSELGEFAKIAGMRGPYDGAPSWHRVADSLRESVQQRRIVVFQQWLSPAELPVLAEPPSPRWQVLPKKRFEQTQFRQRLRVQEALLRFDEWFPVDDYDDAETGPRLVALKQACWCETAAADRVFDYDSVTLAGLAEWAKAAVARGELVVFQEFHRFTGTAAELESYARTYDIELGRKIDVSKLGPAKYDDIKVPHPTLPGVWVPSGKKYTYYDIPGADMDTPIPDEPVAPSRAAAEEAREICPMDAKDPDGHANHRSESAETADADVRRWLRKNNGARRAEDMNRHLGRTGGGGFLASTTRTQVLPKGTKLFRAIRAGAGPGGDWWVPAPLDGDPRKLLALPEWSGASRLVVCELKEDTEVLVGLGAPRCSNKPGGPVQYCLPKEPYFNGVIELEGVKA